MKFLSTSMMPLRLFPCKPVTMLSIGQSPSFCWFASCFSALTRSSHSPSGAACALKTFASFALALSCITSILLGALHSYWPPHAAHNQRHCCLFLPVTLSFVCPQFGKFFSGGCHRDMVTATTLQFFFRGRSSFAECPAMFKRPTSLEAHFFFTNDKDEVTNQSQNM